MALSGRVKCLLKYFHPRSKGSSLVYLGVGAVMSKSDDELKAQYFPDLETSFNRDHRWESVERNLDALFPSVAALDVEAELKGMSKEQKESLLQFICCF